MVHWQAIKISNDFGSVLCCRSWGRHIKGHSVGLEDLDLKHKYQHHESRLESLWTVVCILTFPVIYSCKVTRESQPFVTRWNWCGIEDVLVLYCLSFLLQNKLFWGTHNVDITAVPLCTRRCSATGLLRSTTAQTCRLQALVVRTCIFSWLRSHILSWHHINALLIPRRHL